jgi:hypothetical protein
MMLGTCFSEVKFSPGGFQLLTLVPSEVPLLKLRLLKFEVFGNRLGLAILGDGECELLIQRQSDGFRSVLWLMDFETNVEVLAS